MKHTIRRLPLVPFCLFALAGCDVFDETLIPEDTPIEPTGTAQLFVADELTADAPLNLSYTKDYHDPIDQNAYNDNSGRLPECLGLTSAPGVDFFFAVEMEADQKWHFHVLSTEPSPASNPAIYVLNTPFDPNLGCSGPLAGINACPAGFAEHFSFHADQTQTYYVGVDELEGISERVKIVAANVVCGNGFREHSEYCDPTATGSTGPLADCENCRKVLEDGGDDDSTENAFNDGPLDATHLKLPSGSTEFDFKISGGINTGCDFDFFSFDLDETLTVTASLGDAGCEGMDLDFWDDDGVTNPFELGPVEDCVPRVATLRGGRHWIRVAGRPELGAERPKYTLTLDFE